MTLNAEDAHELITCARQKGLFLMEGLWTRYFPLYRKVEELLKQDAIGPVHSVFADFGNLDFPPTEYYFLFFSFFFFRTFFLNFKSLLLDVFKM